MYKYRENEDTDEGSVSDRSEVSLDDSNMYNSSGNFNQTSDGRILCEGQTVQNAMCEFDCFYNEMMFKLKTLQQTPVIKNKPKKEHLIDESKLFKNLQKDANVKKTLAVIKKLDDDIKDVIGNYKSEKEARLETQLLMCNEIHKNFVPSEKDAVTFLDLCQYEYAESIKDTGEEAEEDKSGSSETNKLESYKGFIKRNKELAKEGLLANYSLTDEEKCKLEEILRIEEDNEENGKVEDLNETCEEDPSESNSYSFSESDRRRLDEIDQELDRYTAAEVDRISYKVVRKYEDNMSDFLLENELKKIDEQLEVLRRNEEDQIKYMIVNCHSEDD